jgi:uncharacterized glyoxalase superfamily protein PhnB
MRTNRTMPSCTVIPELGYADVDEAIRWLCETFGCTVRWRVGNHRAQLNIAGGVVVVRDAWPEARASILVRMADVDAHCQRARERGATIVQEPADHPYGERQYSATDLGGHRWLFSESIADVAPEDWGGTSFNLG